MADLNRETFVVTGPTAGMSRQSVREAVRSNNGIYSDGTPDPGDIVVVSNLHTRPRNTRKYTEAKNKGCRMISDQQFVQILNGGMTLAAALAGQTAPTAPAPATRAAPTAPKPDVLSLIKPSTGTYTVGF